MPIRQPPGSLTGHPTLELLEPFLWVHTLGQDARAPIVVTGTVKPPEGVPMMPAARDGGAAAIRGALFAQAQAAIATVEEAGYTHGWHPEFTIKGDFVRRVDDDGPGEFLRAEAELRLYLKPPG